MTLGVHTTTDRGAIFSRGDVNGVPPDISHGIHHRIVYNRRYEGMGGGARYDTRCVKGVHGKTHGFLTC